MLALPETEAPHLGVSLGGVDVEGVFAKFAGKHLEALSNQLPDQLHGDMPAISTGYEHAFLQLQFQHKCQPSTSQSHLMLP